MHSRDSRPSLRAARMPRKTSTVVAGAPGEMCNFSNHQHMLQISLSTFGRLEGMGWCPSL